jgi:hypothetical protein
MGKWQSRDNMDCDGTGRFSFPNGGTYLDLPAAKQTPTQEKRKDDTWKRPRFDYVIAVAVAVAVAVSNIWTTTRYRERVSFDRYPTVSQRRFVAGKTGYCLEIVFMQKTMKSHKYKKLRRIVWKTFLDI